MPGEDAIVDISNLCSDFVWRVEYLLKLAAKLENL